jgi:hypothetical protein
MRKALFYACLLAPVSGLAQDQGVTPSTEAPASEAEAAPAAAEAPAETEATTPPPTPAPEQGYDVKVRDLEEKVNQLKMRIYQSKARLVRLQEAVLHGVVSGARARIVHRNEMSGLFRLQEAHYFLDGAPLKQMTDVDGNLAKAEELELFQGQIVPGNHQISVNLVYSGNGYGIFTYLRGYRFKIRSSYTFSAEEGKFTELKVVGFESGGITTDLKDRPTIRYDVEVRKDSAKERKAPEPIAGN